MFNNGQEFWDDLVSEYGLVVAATIADNYFNMPLGKQHDVIASEIRFRRELWQAMLDVPNYQCFYNMLEMPDYL